MVAHPPCSRRSLRGRGGARTIAFRDYLRAHADARRAYELLKRDLASRFTSDSHEEYAREKGAFVEAMIARAFHG